MAYRSSNLISLLHSFSRLFPIPLFCLLETQNDWILSELIIPCLPWPGYIPVSYQRALVSYSWPPHMLSLYRDHNYQICNYFLRKMPGSRSNSFLFVVTSKFKPKMSLFRLLPRTAAISRAARCTQTIQARWMPRAMYSGGGPLSRDVITARVLETLKGYEKVDPAKVWCLLITNSVLLTSRRVQLQVSSSFHKDLGLDSLDTVEVMMAVEEVRIIPSCKSQSP